MPEGRPRILIVRPSALGDVARTTPVLVSLRRAYPDAHIDWLINEPFADAVRHHPDLNGVVCFPRRRLSYFGLSPRATIEGLRFARTLRRNHYDLVIDCQGLFRSGLFAWLTRAPQRVGFADARELGHFAYTQRVFVPAHAVHTVDRTLHLVADMGHKIVADMKLYVGEQDRAWLEQFIAENKLTDRGYACIAPTARWGCKRWPIERYTSLARKLLTERVAGDHLIVLAAPDERDATRALLENLRQMRRKDDVSVADRALAPTTTVGQMMALLSRCNLLVANDSAALHLAVGFDRRIVAIFGPTDPAAVGPYRRESSVIQPPQIDPQELADYRSQLDDDSIIRRIELDAVWQKVLQAMARD
ncbi:MAG: glycosyltransferase family 9 protein [Phycisphaeraceae bacterium]|nr:glycosyltransferase family 9 protein [Phycisphaeraceae bacterium]